MLAKKTHAWQAEGGFSAIGARGTDTAVRSRWIEVAGGLKSKRRREIESTR